MSAVGRVQALSGVVRSSLAGAVVACVVLLVPVSARAEFGVVPGSFHASATNAAAEPDVQAGSHPFALTTSLEFNQTTNYDGEVTSDGAVKDILAGQPVGLVGNPVSMPRCTQGAFRGALPPAGAPTTLCPNSTAVGEATISTTSLARNFPSFTLHFPLYNLVPRPGVAAEFGFMVLFVPVTMSFTVRSDGDYGLTANLNNISESFSLTGSSVTIWGVPADAAHDPYRGSCLGTFGESQGACPTGSPPQPLLSMPTSCGGSLRATLTADSWQEPGAFLTNGTEMPAITGCNKISFEPELEARPTTNVSDSPSGLNVDLHVPQNEDPEGLRTADLRKAKVTLPKGLVVNPSGANGLEGCAPAQFDIHGAGPDHCPDASKLGTVEVDSPLVDHPLLGNVFIASPHNNPFNSLLALYIGVNDPETGVVLKLAGKVEVDPQSGQLTTTFNENPQLPFEDLKLKFFGGAKSPLRTPPTCGEYETTSSLTPWSAPESGPPATPSDRYLISRAPGAAACPHTEAEEPNAPGFQGGTLTPIAGAYSPLVLQLHREDGAQQIAQLTVTPPPGLLAKLAGTTYCSDAALAAAAKRSGAEELASPSCPASSKLGTVNVAAGAGPAPFWAKGTAYLAGPYKGAPLSMAIVTPAVAGPFDLGDVVVRAALEVNPETAQITAKSDPIPQALQGIPLDLRTIAVQMNRPGFTRNPTSCNPNSVGAQELSILGQLAPLSQRFQLGNCGALPFKPRLALNLKGGTKRSDNPAFRATLTMPPGGANIARAQVTLPKSEFLDNAHIGTVCTRVQFAADACPAASIYGHATALTPLLDQPLSGPVYLRSSSNKLPDLVADLNGQIEVTLDGKIDTGKGGGIRNTFEVVPDAPVSKFTLEMQGGHKGLLVNSENICRKPQHAIANFTAQSGKISDTTPLISNDCKGGKGKKKARAHR